MIYFIQAATGGRIKIGTSDDVSRRISVLRSVHKDSTLRVLAVMDGGEDEEATIHERFSHLALGGEWFKPDSDLADFIDAKGRPWDGARQSEPLNVWMPVPIMRAFERLCEEETRTKREQLIVILKEYLAKTGRLPPPAPE